MKNILYITIPLLSSEQGWSSEFFD